MNNLLSRTLLALSLESTALWFSNGQPVIAAANREIRLTTQDLNNHSNTELDQSEEFQDAVELLLRAGGGDLIVPAATYSISSDLQFPRNIRLIFSNGAILKVKGQSTLRIDGSILASSDQQIFATDAQSRASVKFGPNIPTVYPRWFGAKGDGATDDTTAINAAVTTGCPDICITSGTYVVNGDTGIRLPSDVHFHGTGPGSVLKGTRLSPGFILKTAAHAERTSISDLKIVTNGTNAIQLFQANYCNIQNVAIHGLGYLHSSEIGIQSVGDSGSNGLFNYGGNLYMRELHTGFETLSMANISMWTNCIIRNCFIPVQNTSGFGFQISNSTIEGWGVNSSGNSVAVFGSDKSGVLQNVIFENPNDLSHSYIARLTATGWSLSVRANVTGGVFENGTSVPPGSYNYVDQFGGGTSNFSANRYNFGNGMQDTYFKKDAANQASFNTYPAYSGQFKINMLSEGGMTTSTTWKSDSKGAQLTIGPGTKLIANDAIAATSAKPWSSYKLYNLRQYVLASGCLLRCTKAGKSGAKEPGSSGGVTLDGTAEWQFVSKLSPGSIFAEAGVRAGLVVATSTPHTIAVDDDTILINGLGSGTFTIRLPATSSIGKRYRIKDAKGDASTHPIVVVPISTTIDGSANYVLRKNYGSAEFVWNGSEWSVF